jgi:hypothetical protein
MNNFIVQSWNVGSPDVDRQRRENKLDDSVLKNLDNGIYLFQEISNKIKDYKNMIFQENRAIIKKNDEMLVESQPYGCAVHWTDDFKFIQIFQPRYFKPLEAEKFKNDNASDIKKMIYTIGERSSPFVILEKNNIIYIVISMHLHVPKSSSDGKRKIMFRSILDDSTDIKNKLIKKYNKKVVSIIGGDLNTQPYLINPLINSNVNYIEKNDLHFLANHKQKTKLLSSINMMTGFRARLDYLILSNNINHSMESIEGISNQSTENFRKTENRKLEDPDKDHARIKTLIIPDMDPNIV